MNKSCVSNRAALAMPSSVECAHHLLQCSAMKQVDELLRARTMSPVFKLPATNIELPPTVKHAASPVFKLMAMIPELPPTIKRVMSPVFELTATISELPPTIERVAGGEHVVEGGSGEKDWESIP